ncbi:MAG: AraC family transcriptional regulator [Paludibacteraceae bacterium]|nr:AraC family transcriptional regulator [Paludibacteraceae bacterium]
MRNARQKDGFKGQHVVVLSPLVVDIARKDPLTSSLYITDIGYYPKAHNHYRQRLEPISEQVLIYCVEGSGWYELRGEHTILKSGEYVILPAGEPHCYGASDTPWTIYWVHFSGEQSAIYAKGAQTPQRISANINSRIRNRNSLFEEMLVTLERGENLEDLRYVSSLLHYYLASMRYLQQYRSAQEAGSTDPVDAIIHYMREHIESNVTLDDIARYAGYSVSHLSSRFRQRTGLSPIHYLNLLRIERACALLRETDLKLNQISYRIGIEDNYYFSRLFSKFIGMSPSEYRRKVKSEK